MIVTEHAAQRFVERVRPAMSRGEAAVELGRLLADFGRVVDRPGWVSDQGSVPGFWVEISDGIVVPCCVSGGLEFAVTVLTRAERSPEFRADKARRRRPRHTHRGVKAAQRGRRHGGTRPPPVVEEW